MNLVNFDFMLSNFQPSLGHPYTHVLFVFTSLFCYFQRNVCISACKTKTNNAPLHLFQYHLRYGLWFNAHIAKPIHATELAQI